MKHTKSAAVVAGSLMALGAAAPAVANDAAPGSSFSLNGGLEQALESDQLAAPPIDSPQVDGLVDAVKGTADSGEPSSDKSLLGAGESLLGGMPLGL